MSKTLKIIGVSLILTTVFLILAYSTVLAQATTYTSSIYMDANSTLTGSTRNYKQRNHRITIYPTMIDGSTNITNGVTKMHIALVRKKWFSTTTVQTTTARMPATRKTYSYEMGNHDTGDYYYYFSTFGTTYTGGEFRADPVNMICYD